MKIISTDNKQQQYLLTKLTGEIDAALKLLRGSHHIVGAKDLMANSSLPPNLLDQSLALCEEYSTAKSEPIRTVHHLACSGGSLISKCIASMPNTQLLSEVDPLSTPITSSVKPEFTPTDMVSLMRQSTRGTSTELILDLFLRNLEIIYSRSKSWGLRLILRDHAHSHYCRGGIIPERPNLLKIVEMKFPALSIVTVRDPIDSYLSLQENEWVHFSPATFDEYCARYAAFIRSYEGLPVVRYEDFVKNPPSEMERICNYLDLSFNPDFLELFSVHRISGDSGRRGEIIEQRPRRTVDPALLQEMQTSAKYQHVLSMLGYSSI